MVANPGRRPVKILDGGEAETFRVAPEGTYQILITVYGSNELTLQYSVDDGANWVNTDVTFDAVGAKRFGAVNVLYRLNASTLTGATAWCAQESRSGD